MKWQYLTSTVYQNTLYMDLERNKQNFLNVKQKKEFDKT